MNYRYPGPQSFTEADELLFFGRTRETKALYDLIMVQPLVVLFAKSGMGKTSLLQAGIVPRLRFTEYDPIVLRLNDTKVPLAQQVLRKIAPGAEANTTLWAALTQYNQVQKSTPLLIFDQFEEIFTLYTDEQRTNFARQLSDVVNQTLPEDVRHQIRDSALGAEDLALLEQIPKVKMVLSIRSDLLHYLHLLSPEIPSILRNRFELSGLRPKQAEEAIVKPATQEQEIGDYASPKFTYSTEATHQMLSYLSRRQQTLYTGGQQESEIESFQLQLLCEHIERKIVNDLKNGVLSPPVTITPAFYGGEAGIDQILSEFYTHTLESIPNATQQEKARQLIEGHLVKNERRVSVDEATITQTHGVNTATLELLVNKRLLRQDVRETGDYFEISHDTLLAPIMKSRLEWERREAARKRRRLIGVVFMALILAAGAIAFGIWAYNLSKEAETQRNEAEKHKKNAEEEATKAKLAQMHSDSLLEAYKIQQKIAAAAQKDGEIKGQALVVAKAEKVRMEFEEIYNAANTLFSAGQFRNAKLKYQEAFRIAPPNLKYEIQEKIKQCTQ